MPSHSKSCILLGDILFKLQIIALFKHSSTCFVNWSHVYKLNPLLGGCQTLFRMTWLIVRFFRMARPVVKFFRIYWAMLNCHLLSTLTIGCHLPFASVYNGLPKWSLGFLFKRNKWSLGLTFDLIQFLKNYKTFCVLTSTAMQWKWALGEHGK